MYRILLTDENGDQAVTWKLYDCWTDAAADAAEAEYDGEMNGCQIVKAEVFEEE